MLARSETATAQPDQHAALLGADPMLPSLWIWSAQRQSTPEASLEVLRRGRDFAPSHSDLVLREAPLLAALGRADELTALAQHVLAGDCPALVQAWLRWYLVIGDLLRGDTVAAEADALALGGVRGVDPAQVSDAWARIAVEHAFLGRLETADAVLERSLDLGPAGLAALHDISMRAPERKAACDELVARARSRAPGNPDLLLAAAVQALIGQDFAAGRQALDELPAALPERLVRDVELRHAQVDVLSGDPQSALPLLRRRLNDDPADPDALALLMECWRKHALPTAAEVRIRLQWARGRITHPALAAQAEALLRELPAGEPPAGGP